MIGFIESVELTYHQDWLVLQLPHTPMRYNFKFMPYDKSNRCIFGVIDIFSENEMRLEHYHSIQHSDIPLAMTLSDYKLSFRTGDIGGILDIQSFM